MHVVQTCTCILDIPTCIADVALQCFDVLVVVDEEVIQILMHAVVVGLPSVVRSIKFVLGMCNGGVCIDLSLVQFHLSLAKSFQNYICESVGAHQREDKELHTCGGGHFHVMVNDGLEVVKDGLVHCCRNQEVKVAQVSQVSEAGGHSDQLRSDLDNKDIVEFEGGVECKVWVRK